MGPHSCWWQRLSGFGGTSHEVIANKVALGPLVATIHPSDAGFHSGNCGTWSSDLSAITSSTIARFEVVSTSSVSTLLRESGALAERAGPATGSGSAVSAAPRMTSSRKVSVYRTVHCSSQSVVVIGDSVAASAASGRRLAPDRRPYTCLREPARCPLASLGDR